MHLKSPALFLMYFAYQKRSAAVYPCRFWLSTKNTTHGVRVSIPEPSVATSLQWYLALKRLKSFSVITSLSMRVLRVNTYALA
ncbi:Uncharacterised protein [Vibrio cholerae]|nr:Uncharacterised protein [Vibrio cholerae]